MCEICRRLAEIDSLWIAIGIKDATAHPLWNEYEWLLNDLYCLATYLFGDEIYEDEDEVA